MTAHKIFALTVFMLALIQASFSQTSLKEYGKRLEGIISLDDLNEQKYRLAIFDKEFEEWLMHNEPGTDIQLPVKHISSDDNRFNIFYYTLKRAQKDIRYVLFVKYRDDKGDVQVHIFNQKITPDVKSSEKIKDPEIRMSTMVIEGVKLYEVSFAGNRDPLVWMKYSDLKLMCMFEEINKSRDDERKKAINKKVLNRLKLLWNSSGYYENDFSGISRMKTLFSDDGKLKICTYGILFNDFTNLFSGAVIVKDDKNIKVFELTDKTGTIRSPSRMSLPSNKWYGAMYLDIIERKYQKKTYYTLLGYKGQDEFVKTRVVDVLWFAGNKPRFGAPLFKNDRLTYNRLIFKYSIGANMVLRYDARKKMIVMDNLEPSDAMYKGVYRFYGPDFTYNGYKFEKGKWILYRNIDLRNPEK